MTHQLNYAEHRWGARIQVSVPVHVSSPSETAIDGRMRNLSLSGALMTTTLAAPLNSRIAVTLTLSSPSQGDAVKDLLRSPSVRLPV